MKIVETTIIFIITFFITASLHAADFLPVMSVQPTKSEWQEFACMGGGYVKIPDDLLQYVDEALLFADALPEHKGATGYFEEPELQLTSIMLNQTHWSEFPTSTRLLFEGMSKVAVQILNHVLHALDVAPGDFENITDGLSVDKGSHEAKVLHYVPERKKPAIVAHKDLRFVSVLLTRQPGLRGIRGEQDFPIDPKEGYFIINLGLFFEALFDDPSRLTALVHYIPQLNVQRSSLGVFSRGAQCDYFYQYDGKELVQHPIAAINRYKVQDPGNHFSHAQHKLGKD